jgi:hypothetical protein
MKFSERKKQTFPWPCKLVFNVRKQKGLNIFLIFNSRPRVSNSFISMKLNLILSIWAPTGQIKRKKIMDKKKNSRHRKKLPLCESIVKTLACYNKCLMPLIFIFFNKANLKHSHNLLVIDIDKKNKKKTGKHNTKFFWIGSSYKNLNLKF